MRTAKQTTSPGLEAYEQRIIRELRILIAEKNIAQKTIARKLEQIGIYETPKGLSAKLAAGTFSAAYYLAIKEVIQAL